MGAAIATICVAVVIGGVGGQATIALLLTRHEPMSDREQRRLRVHACLALGVLLAVMAYCLFTIASAFI